MAKKPQGQNENKKSKKRWEGVAFLCILAVIVGFGAYIFFSQPPSPPEDDLPYETFPPHIETVSLNFYFPTSNLEEWDYEERQIEVKSNNAMIEAVLEGLLEGPRRAYLSSILPSGISVIQIQFAPADNIVEVFFSSNFRDDISSGERIRLTGSMVHTFIGLDFVDGLRFFVGNDRSDPLFASNPIRDRYNTILVDVPPPRPSTNITLYFPDDQVQWLFPEQRSVYVDEIIGIYTFAVEALIQGPTTPGLNPILPATTTILIVERIENTVFVDFSTDFLLGFAGGSAMEQMVIFAIVNTLTELPGVYYVQIFINGSRPYQDHFHMNLLHPIERNEGLIR